MASAVGRPLPDELESLRESLLAMGRFVEDQIRTAVSALLKRRPDLTDDVIEHD